MQIYDLRAGRLLGHKARISANLPVQAALINPYCTTKIY